MTGVPHFDFCVSILQWRYYILTLCKHFTVEVLHFDHSTLFDSFMADVILCFSLFLAHSRILDMCVVHFATVSTEPLTSEISEATSQ